MKIFIISIFTLLSSTVYARLSNESELGILIAKGNSDSENWNAKETAGISWDEFNLLKFSGRYLETKTKNVESGRYWLTGLRYDRSLSPRLGMFIGEIIESDKYAGYNQKYNSDIGVKYSIIKEKNILWNAELGYRHTIENQLSGSQNKFNYVRAYTEVTRNLAENISSKIDIEYLPNFSVASDYQMNGEFSITASLNNIFSIKTGYQLRYNNWHSFYNGIVSKILRSDSYVNFKNQKWGILC